MIYNFEIDSATKCLGNVDIDLSESEVQIIKDIIKENGVFNLYDIEDYNESLYWKILEPCNDAAEEAIRKIHKEFAESCGEEFDEDNFEVDWQNEYVEVLCPDEFYDD